MSAARTELPFLDALRAELVAAHPARRRARRARPVGLAAAAAAIVVAIAAVTIVRPDPATAAVVVTETAAGVVVDIRDEDGTVSFAELVAALEAVEHTEITARAVPAAPSGVGRLVSAAAPAGRVALERPAGTGFLRARVLDAAGARVTLALGRPARPGEKYHRAVDAVGPGGPLACEPLVGRPVAEAAARLATTDLAVVWQHASGARAPTPPAVGYVAAVLAVGPATVQVQVIAEAVPAREPAACP